MGASSAGCPARPRATSLPKAFTFSFGMVAGIRGVQIGPGATQFARIPFLPSIWASPPVKFWIAALVIAYGRSCGLGVSAWMDDVLITDPPAGMCATAALV